MTLHRSDYDQAARYLKYACELLERQAFGKTVTLREVLQMAARASQIDDPSRIGAEYRQSALLPAAPTA